jgi:hypothetical protein
MESRCANTCQSRDLSLLGNLGTQRDTGKDTTGHRSRTHGQRTNGIRLWGNRENGLSGS